MHKRIENTKNSEPQTIVRAEQHFSQGELGSVQFAGHRSESDVFLNMQQKANSSNRLTQLQLMQQKADAQPSSIIQRKSNSTGLPDNLKAGVEQLSGQSMDNVKVHYNSPKPAQLQAHAFAQGNDIHLASGQEKHLPHEAWHVAQQAQGRVKPTKQLKSRVAINDDAGLEKEADVMGAKALQIGSGTVTQQKPLEKGSQANETHPVQRVLSFAGGMNQAVQALITKAAQAYPELVADDKFVIHFVADASLAQREAIGNTEYGGFTGGQLHLFGPNISSVLAKAPSEKLDKIGAYITFNPAAPALELSAAMAHEMALHVVPFYQYRDMILGGTSEELDILKANWAKFAQHGALSEDLQHARFGGGAIDLYLSMVKGQMSLLKKPAQQGEVAFFFITDFFSKLRFFRDGFAKSEEQKAVITEEMHWLLQELGPFEAANSDKSALAAKFDEIVAKIKAYTIKRQAVGKEAADGKEAASD